MPSGEKTTVLKEEYQLSGVSKFDRYHLILGRSKTNWRTLGLIQEIAGSRRYTVYSLANTTVRVELSDGGHSRPPIAEVYLDGQLVFRGQLGGRRPRPIRFGDFQLIPCQWGDKTPQEIWGQDVKVEEVGGDPPSDDKGGETLPI